MTVRPVVIRFFGAINDTSTKALLAAIDDKLKQGATDFTLLISSQGGGVFQGLSAYNYIRGVPANFTTHNYGQVDSVATVLYCAGKKRLSVPDARFLLHGLFQPLQGQFHEKQLDEHLKGLQSSSQNMANAIAVSIGKRAEEIAKAMLAGTTLNSEQAKEWGFVHEIRSELYPTGSEIIYIQ